MRPRNMTSRELFLLAFTQRTSSGRNHRRLTSSAMEQGSSIQRTYIMYVCMNVHCSMITRFRCRVLGYHLRPFDSLSLLPEQNICLTRTMWPPRMIKLIQPGSRLF